MGGTSLVYRRPWPGRDGESNTARPLRPTCRQPPPSGLFWPVEMVCGLVPSRLAHYQRSLALSQELGDKAGLRISYHQLGILAQQRGDHAEAESCYHRSLAPTRSWATRWA